MTREPIEVTRQDRIYCLKASSDYHSEVCEECKFYPNCDHMTQDDMTELTIKDLEALEQEPKTEWIPIEWKSFGKNGYPKPEDEYKHFLTVDNKGEITIQEFLLTLDEEPQPYFTGMRNVIAWMPLPDPYEPQESEVRE